MRLGVRRFGVKWPRRARVRHVHLSGRFDRSVRLLRAVTRLYRINADIITKTETQEQSRGQVLEEFFGFHVVRGKSGLAAECAIMLRKSRYRVLRTWFLDVGGPSNQSHVPVGLARDRLTGQTILVFVLHAPHGVEGIWRHRYRDKKVQQYLDVLDNLAVHLDRIIEEHNPDAILGASDWNLNLHLAWVRVLIAKHLDLAPLRADITPKGGTHGKGWDRLIDWCATRGLYAMSASILPIHAASDHRPIRHVWLMPPIRIKRRHR